MLENWCEEVCMSIESAAITTELTGWLVTGWSRVVAGRGDGFGSAGDAIEVAFRFFL